MSGNSHDRRKKRRAMERKPQENSWFKMFDKAIGQLPAAYRVGFDPATGESWSASYTVDDVYLKPTPLRVTEAEWKMLKRCLEIPKGMNPETMWVDGGEE